MVKNNISTFNLLEKSPPLVRWNAQNFNFGPNQKDAFFVPICSHQNPVLVDLCCCISLVDSSPAQNVRIYQYCCHRVRSFVFFNFGWWDVHAHVPLLCKRSVGKMQQYGFFKMCLRIYFLSFLSESLEAVSLHQIVSKCVRKRSNNFQ